MLKYSKKKENCFEIEKTVKKVFWSWQHWVRSGITFFSNETDAIASADFFIIKNVV